MELTWLLIYSCAVLATVVGLDSDDLGHSGRRAKVCRTSRLHSKPLCGLIKQNLSHCGNHVGRRTLSDGHTYSEGAAIDFLGQGNSHLNLISLPQLLARYVDLAHTPCELIPQERI